MNDHQNIWRYTLILKNEKRISLIHERKKDKDILWHKFFNEQLSENVCKYTMIFMIKNKRRRRSYSIREKKEKKEREKGIFNLLFTLITVSI